MTRGEAQAVAVFRCDLCGAADDSVCGCPDFYSRPETLEAMRRAREAGRAQQANKGNDDARAAYEEEAYDRRGDR